MTPFAWLIFLTSWEVAGAELARFWHISDLHLDPNYTVSKDPLQVCPSAGSQPVLNAGPWGDYLCDSPWALINSSFYAMKEIEPKPDFILWTGDDTPHVPNERLGEAAVLAIVERLTNLMKEVFPESNVCNDAWICRAYLSQPGMFHKDRACSPSSKGRYLGSKWAIGPLPAIDTKVYAALGNHDFHPKNQFPAQSNSIYNQVAELWRPWLSNESYTLFKRGAFYSEKLPGPSRTGRVVVLNTNLYYSSNEQTAGMADPGQQFQWLGDVLSNASRDGEMVYIIGHVPPGFFEKTQNRAWFRESFNEEYLKVIQKHHHVIAGQFFGHHHTDSFRMFYDSTGAPISVMFLTPGVTPWKTTLPGVVDGANNPGIRIFEYDRATLNLKDMVTYFLNLRQANVLETPLWEQEYRLTEAYQVPDASPSSMHTALTRIASEPDILQRYYIYNSVSYNHFTCEDICRLEHVCAIQQVAFSTYATCLHGLGAKLVPGFLLILTLLPSLHILEVL